MGLSNKIKVEVAYARPDRQCIIEVEVTEDSTIQQVIEQSGMVNEFPEIDLGKAKVGIFSKQKQLTDTVREGDRVEIYRPLIIDPKEARRAKAKMMNKK